MSFYKRFGPIQFIRESEALMLLHSESYWIIKPKNQRDQDILQTVVQTNNAHCAFTWVKLHREEREDPCFIISKSLASLVEITDNRNINFFCEIIEALAKSLLAQQNISVKIHSINSLTFFRIKLPENTVAHNFSYFSRNSSSQNQDVLKEIKNFIENEFGQNNQISFRLLISKINKARSVLEVLDEVQYFQKIYGLNKSKNELKEQIYSSNEKKIVFKRRNRSYRKSFREENTERKNSISFNKKSSLKKISFSSDYKRPVSKVKGKFSTFHISLQKNQSKQKLHLSQNISFQTTQRKPQKKLKMFNESKIHKHQSKLKYFTNSTNSLWKNTHNNIKKQPYNCSTFSLDKNPSFSNINETNNPNESEKLDYNGFDINEIVNQSLSKWQERMKEKKNKEIPLKTIKSIIMENNGMKENRKQVSENYNLCVNADLQRQNKKQKNNFAIQEPFFAEEIKMIGRQEINNEQFISNEVKQLETISIGMRKKDKVEKKDSKIAHETGNEKKMQMADSKTKRKKQTPYQIIEQSFITKTQDRLAKLEYIGSCVVNTPKILSKMKNEKIFWQVPCFLLYKQFYMSRQNVVDHLFSEAKEIKSTKIEELIEQLRKQNEQTKQSLKKLLKVALKKVNKFNFDEKSLSEIKSCLNLDYSCEWHQKLNDMAANFLITLQELQKSHQQIIAYEIQFLDAFLIAKNKRFDIEERRKLDKMITSGQASEQIEKYCQKRLAEVCKILNSKLI